MLTSFYSALTGLNNNSLSINVIGDNLANLNSTGFKGSRAFFSELVGSGAETATNGNPIQVGLGSSSTGVSPVFTQGSILTTGRSSDVAISGSGFFVVSTGDDGIGFTRAGNLTFTKDGELLTGEGFKLVGYPATNGTIDTNAGLGPIIVPKGSSQPPQATTRLSVGANLDAREAVGGTFSTSIQVYDSLGTAHVVSLTFTKASNGNWSWTATVPAEDTGGAVTAPPTTVGTGSLTFDNLGLLTGPTTDPTLAITGLANGAANMNLTFSLRDANDAPLLTNYSSASAVSSTTQDGCAASVLREISFGSDGIVTGIYESGQVRPLAQVVLANFPNVEGLLKFKGATFVDSVSSGEPSIGIPGTGGRGTLTGSALELSNVDIAQEFTNIIVAQRGYQANSKVITVTDELYQDAINMKR